jgi:hypothetical protein
MIGPATGFSKYWVYECEFCVCIQQPLGDSLFQTELNLLKLQVGVLVREVWRGLSARALMAGEAPAADKGLTRKVDGLTLTRSALLA